MTWHTASITAPTPQQLEPCHRNQQLGWRPCMEWCVHTFGGGIGATAWGPGWHYVGEGVFEFQREQHCAWFLLRWGS